MEIVDWRWREELLNYGKIWHYEIPVRIRYDSEKGTGMIYKIINKTEYGLLERGIVERRNCIVGDSRIEVWQNSIDNDKVTVHLFSYGTIDYIVSLGMPYEVIDPVDCEQFYFMLDANMLRGFKIMSKQDVIEWFDSLKRRS